LYQDVVTGGEAEAALVSFCKAISISSETDIVSARVAGRQLANEAGLNDTQKHCLMTAISELASNILYHAGEGRVTLRIVFRDGGIQGVEVIASDQGAGIADLRLALKDGFSTRGSMGCGLPGVNRMMTEIEISSEVGVGTLVRAVKWADETPRFTMACSLPPVPRT
jgi:serine/threonine-protein kinase RsbT